MGLFPLKGFWLFKMKRIATLFFCLLLSLVILSPQKLWAYTDVILIAPDELWKAIEEVMKPYGIKKMDSKKYSIQSKWVEDQVERKRPVIPILKTNIAVTQTSDRRYRIKISLEKVDLGTQIRIQGEFQEKLQLMDGHPQNPWKKVKPQMADYNIERDFFYKILRQLEKAQKNTNETLQASISTS